MIPKLIELLKSSIFTELFTSKKLGLATAWALGCYLLADNTWKEASWVAVAAILSGGLPVAVYMIGQAIAEKKEALPPSPPEVKP